MIESGSDAVESSPGPSQDPAAIHLGHPDQDPGR